MHRLRNYFLTGLIVAAPLVLTVYITWAFIEWIDSWVKPYIPAAYNPDNYLPLLVPGFGLVVALVFLTLLGFLTANLVGRTLVSYGENLLGRMPFVRSIYRGLKQIFETVLSNAPEIVPAVGLIEYPREGVWSLVFIATATSGEIAERLARTARRSSPCFLPTTPNPTDRLPDVRQGERRDHPRHDAWRRAPSWSSRPGWWRPTTSRSRQTARARHHEDAARAHAATVSRPVSSRTASSRPKR